ncbi:MAG TPA: hypothetical protein VF791_23635 [Pyrinomonadaceae bacterium]
MRELISQALKERFGELCRKRIISLAPEKFGEQAAYVSLLRERLLKATPAEIKEDSKAALHVPDHWTETGAGCLPSLRALSLCQRLELRPAHLPPPVPFVKLLKESGPTPSRRFQLLAERYSCPLNIALDVEEEVREYVLNSLMVRDRARVEKGGVAPPMADELLLKLSLMSVAAALLPDLRFLDALNYYYELLPAEWLPSGQSGWLLVCYYGLYARALAAWI